MNIPMQPATIPTIRPAWREPMVWLIWALPAAVIVAGFSTLYIAIRAGGADAIPWEVRRTAQIQQEDVRADQRAAALGLRAQLSIDPATGALTLEMLGKPNLSDLQLRLLLAHPSHAERDQELVLTRSGGSHWYGRINAVGMSAWNLQLSSLDQQWRLRGRLNANSQYAELLPTVLE